MVISATEYKTNFELVNNEDIYIAKNDKTVARIINYNVLAVGSLKDMLKDLPKDIDLNERLAKKIL